MDGMYGLPAGHLDGNETAREGGAREFHEEIGIDMNPYDLEVVHVMHRKAESDERIDFFMTTQKYVGKLKNMEPEKCDGWDWYDLNNLPGHLFEFCVLAFECFRTGQNYFDL